MRRVTAVTACAQQLMVHRLSMSPIVLLLLLTAAGSAFSDDVPVLNIEPVCRGIAEQASQPSERGGPDLSFSQCVKSEDLMRQQLVKEWPTFVPADKDSCVVESQSGAEVSYTDFLTCLEMARDVRLMNTSGPH